MRPLLTGLQVIELGSVVLGPLAGQILGDLGAEVIKIEPLDGDIARASYPGPKNYGTLYVNNNRNKKTIAIDLKSPAGNAIARRMIAGCDVFLHNMRMEAIERIGLDFQSIAKLNRRVVYCSMTGFGRQGRYRNRPAFDDIIQAASGLAGLTYALGGEPRFFPTILADKIAALYAVYGILATLVARERGRDQPVHVEVPMFEAAVSFVLNEHLAGATFEESGSVGYPRILAQGRRPYRSRDGWIAVLPYTAEQWRRFLCEVGRADVCAQDWFEDGGSRQARISELYAIVASVLPERDTSVWIETLSKLDIPCSPIRDLQDLLADPHLADIDFFKVCDNYSPEIERTLPQPVIFEGVDVVSDTPPPLIGADTAEILRRFHYEDAEIESLIAEGVVRQREEKMD